MTRFSLALMLQSNRGHPADAQHPVGSTVHNVEMKPRKGSQLARSAGTFVCDRCS